MKPPSTKTPHKMLPVWFFVGMLLLAYGIIIFAVGIGEYSHPAAVVLASEHLSLWGGLLLIVIGGFYTVRFRPRRRKYDVEKAGKKEGS